MNPKLIRLLKSLNISFASTNYGLAIGQEINQPARSGLVFIRVNMNLRI